MILEIYRGYTITDEPNGGYPFSIYDEERNLLMDTDSDTIEQARRSVDFVADEKEAEEQAERDREYRSRYRHALDEWRDMRPGYSTW